ncbi:Squamosa promoter binding protein-like 14 [Tripterygium wilfordii]|uniref:Squamosa promoter binding protein-like 14 n=1 Tax=Tripterygium wilfordii TaxID=458696 RepID=A0A7J7CZ18_TRIWF|nr:squamosa promoter-binding-like protein 14 [Tripterygium wilfordii]XP_038718123.1 squamosa promoter-binding-like protein 14 [Tripterygium wilfordii]XP_038718124.1 squamosa promoter-binding-like protein 14 [Tripterygium wilfordii]KAF5739268.1 Squamosa promoter binding protein-like 14 [Tripterygium wilfordii]
MEDIGAQVAPPIFFQSTLSSRFCEAPPMSRKRDLSYQIPNFHHQSLSQHQFVQNPRDNWNPKSWEWDPVRFLAKPLDSETLQLGTATTDQMKKDQGLKKKNTVEEDDDSLRLNLGGGLNSVEEPVSRSNKRVRSGSPGSSSYPKCQVDDCEEDLTNAKDYHRRHKVCELHSKSSKALVGKQMQRFCQQCSRFHPLSEFDEGKRSCRRRLAGHNRRRRKTQPDDVTSGLLLPGNRENTSGGNLDIVSLLTALARTQGKNEEKSINNLSVQDRDQLIQVLSKINSLPLPMDIAAKLPSVGSLIRKNAEQPSSECQNRLSGNTSPSTMDLLAVLSTTRTPSASDTHAVLSQRSSQSSDSEKTRLTYADQASGPNLRKVTSMKVTVTGGERSSTSCQSPVEDSDCQVEDTRANLPLQLFSPSPGDDGPPKLSLSKKYFSSDSSNPMDDRSPSSSPPLAQKLFSVPGIIEPMKPEKVFVGREANVKVEGAKAHGGILPLRLFGGSNVGTDHTSYQNFRHQAGYTSSSGSDHSPPSLNSDPQDRTGRIIFKLFDKDPSHFPGTLRTQIYNWLSKSPSEMESYIRPGCVVLSIYVNMSATAWKQLEGNLLQHVGSLVQDSDSDFWRKGRFLVQTDRQLASYKDGRIRLCKSWRSWSSPELISVSPLAVVGGQETSLTLRGRNLANPGTKIHCMYMGGYESKEVTRQSYHKNSFEEVKLGHFKIRGASPAVLGRCFIEVENGFRGNSFPLIIADASICKELSLLESEINEEAKACDLILEDVTHDFGGPRSKEEIIHFLNEVGWLFQKKNISSLPDAPKYSVSRFKFLLIFSVERDYCALVKILLDMLVDTNLDRNGLSEGTLEMLSESQLLNRVVKRRCRKMADLLIHYSIIGNEDAMKKYIFPPNLEGPGGITPLHLAACTSGSDDMIDSLTNDPQEIGLTCWDSLLDSNGLSPSGYALLRNNLSYNKLVAHKLADRRNGQVSMTIGDETEQTGSALSQEPQFKQGSLSCAKCAIAAAKYSRRIPGSQGLLHRPYIHSMLAIAAVCVCVCLFFRGAPDIGLIAPIKWENLEFGTI